MKNLLLSLAVIGLAFGCRSTDNTTVTDAEGLNAPTDCATDCATSCDEAAKAECMADKAECSDAAKAECSEAAKAECSSAAATECTEAQVCPITGAAIE